MGNIISLNEKDYSVELEFSIAQKNYSLSVQKKNEHYQLKIGDQTIELQAIKVTPHWMMLSDQNGTQRICVASTTDKIFIHFNGHQYVVDHPEQKEKAAYQSDEHLSGADAGIYAPMPGKILKIMVQENQPVEAKQNLIIVEAMKMEHSVRAPKKGIVKKINFKEGDLVDTGQEIMEIDFQVENEKT
ncbi:MAG TPA: biotin/lipoyl-containing protein [bacterium]